MKESTTPAHSDVLSIGVRDTGEIDISSTNSNVAVIQWLLARAVFEVNLIEYNDRKLAVTEATQGKTKKPPQAKVKKQKT
tara:strand:+ start:264 stop:503 length:240 start_codon:yes stop_codon:yes gene_type:complete